MLCSKFIAILMFVASDEADALMIKRLQMENLHTQASERDIQDQPIQDRFSEIDAETRQMIQALSFSSVEVFEKKIRMDEITTAEELKAQLMRLKRDPGLAQAHEELAWKWFLESIPTEDGKTFQDLQNLVGYEGRQPMFQDLKRLLAPEDNSEDECKPLFQQVSFIQIIVNTVERAKTKQQWREDLKEAGIKEKCRQYPNVFNYLWKQSKKRVASFLKILQTRAEQEAAQEDLEPNVTIGSDGPDVRSDELAVTVQKIPSTNQKKLPKNK